MPYEPGILIIGGGLGGSTVASELAEAGNGDLVTILEADADAPYDRPPLTKTLLSDEDHLSDWPPWAPEAVRWRRDRVVEVDVMNKSVRLASGAELTAGAIVLAAGARARRLPGRNRRVLTIRSAADARVLRGLHREGARRFLIEGAGPLGLELASSLSLAGAEVTVVEAAIAPMVRLLGYGIGPQVSSWVSESGVSLRLATKVTHVYDEDGASSLQVVLNDGSSGSYDCMISTVGSVPSPIRLVDSHGTLTSVVADVDGHLLGRAGLPVPDVYAVGDIAVSPGPDGLLRRSEAWTSARVQGQAVSRHLMGRERSDIPVPYFWTRQFGRMVQVLGEVSPRCELALLTESSDRNGALYQMSSAGVAVAYVGVNAQRSMATLQTQVGPLEDWVPPKNSGAPVREAC